MRKIYKVCIESVVWYASAAWMPWLSKSSLDRLERAQQKALRRMCGLTKNAPTASVYEEAEIVPLRVEAKRRAMICYEKAMRCSSEDPRKEMCEQVVNN